jgi:hypothetical protein
VQSAVREAQIPRTKSSAKQARLSSRNAETVGLGSGI